MKGIMHALQDVFVSSACRMYVFASADMMQ